MFHALCLESTGPRDFDEKHECGGNTIEAAKRWQWSTNLYGPWEDYGQDITPTFIKSLRYRRKPGIPWPKVIQQPGLTWPEDAPDWANYMAQDKDGEVRFYENRPRPFRTCWIANGRSEFGFTAGILSWKGSLITRPQSPTKKKVDD